jgi:phospholipase C
MGSKHMGNPFGLEGYDEHRWRGDVTRRRLLQGMLATAGLAATGAGVSSWVTQGPARASGMILGPGTRPDPTKPAGVDLLPQIEHIIIYMQENQSYDHYLGTLGRGDGFTLDGQGNPTNFNLDSSNNKVTVYHEADTCNAISGDHSWNGTHRSINGGAMDGFAKDSGAHVMGYYDETNLPFYRGLANTFPICDRWFSSVPGPTHPNRRFLQAATSAGMVTTDVNYVLAHPTPPNGTIWDRLDDHGITWKDYAIDLWDVLLWPGPQGAVNYINTHKKNLFKFADFLHDCYHGTLPAVSIIAPGTQDQYDEGSRDVQNGEAYSYSIINAVMDSPLWHRSAIFFMYDEHGGGYDHVPPPAAVAPDNIAPDITPSDEQGGFDMYGVRVPAYVISPYAKKDYVSHVVHDHTSVLKFIETKWNLPAMTARDANADNLFDAFDFSKRSFPEPVDLPAPGLPADGSVCQPQPRPDVNPKTSPYPDPSDTTTTTTTTSTPGSSTSTTGSGVSGNGVGVSPGAQPVAGNPTFTG